MPARAGGGPGGLGFERDRLLLVTGAPSRSETRGLGTYFVAAERQLGGREIVFRVETPDAALEDRPFHVEAVLGAAYFERAGVLVLDPQKRQSR